MPIDGRFQFEIMGGETCVAYLRLPTHPGIKVGVVKRTVSLRDLVDDYKGPDVNLDFADGDVLIGIEVVG